MLSGTIRLITCVSNRNVYLPYGQNDQYTWMPHNMFRSSGGPPLGPSMSNVQPSKAAWAPMQTPNCVRSEWSPSSPLGRPIGQKDTGAQLSQDVREGGVDTDAQPSELRGDTRVEHLKRRAPLKGAPRDTESRKGRLHSRQSCGTPSRSSKLRPLDGRLVHGLCTLQPEPGWSRTSQPSMLREMIAASTIKTKPPRNVSKTAAL